MKSIIIPVKSITAEHFRTRFVDDCWGCYQDFKTSVIGTKPRLKLTKFEKPDVMASTQSLGKKRPTNSYSNESIIRIVVELMLKEIHLAKLKKIIEKKSHRSLPGLTPQAVHEALIKRFLQRWEDLALNCFEAALVHLKRRVDVLSEKYFRRFSSSVLLAKVRHGIPRSTPSDMILGNSRLK